MRVGQPPWDDRTAGEGRHRPLGDGRRWNSGEVTVFELPMKRDRRLHDRTAGFVSNTWHHMLFNSQLKSHDAIDGSHCQSYW